MNEKRQTSDELLKLVQEYQRKLKRDKKIRKLSYYFIALIVVGTLIFVSIALINA